MPNCDLEVWAPSRLNRSAFVRSAVLTETSAAFLAHAPIAAAQIRCGLYSAEVDQLNRGDSNFASLLKRTSFGYDGPTRDPERALRTSRNVPQPVQVWPQGAIAESSGAGFARIARLG